MKPDRLTAIPLSCMVEFENDLVQIIVMAQQCVMNKNHVLKSNLYVAVCT